jgi:hypothetical protein
MVLREETGCSLLRKTGNGSFVILKLRDDEPLFDVEARKGTAEFGMPLDMFVGKVDEDGDLISLWVDRRRFEPLPEEVLRRAVTTCWQAYWKACPGPILRTPPVAAASNCGAMLRPSRIRRNSDGGAG